VPKRILVVDDDDDIRDLTAAGLELTRGWTVISASGGIAAIKEACLARPDAILLDVLLPDMDGPAAFRVLRSRAETERIPVIFLTGRAHDPHHYLRLGAAGVIAKPFDPLTLGERVAETLRWRD
jgi:DNA-binding response OmpR family regulator